MATKMEVLKRGAGARAAPRVLLDASLSMNFQIPANMTLRKPQAPAARPSLAIAAEEGAPPEMPELVVTEERDEEDDSWENKDWGENLSEQGNAPPAVGAAGRASALRRVMDTRMEWVTTDELPAADDGNDAWEEADAPDLPDDFPVLIVNLSRLRDLHFRSESDAGGAYAIAMDTDDELREFYATVKRTLHAHFTQMTEVLFEQEVCIHAHYGTQRRLLENLHRAYPTHVFALVDYPPQLGDLALHEYLHVLTSPTRWPSVNYLKDCLRKCSRDLEWKFEIAIELERLAQQEHDWYTREQQLRSDEIDALTRLRDSFRDKLRSGGDSARNTNQYLLLRKLEDIETRLLALIDAYLAEPELTPRESRELMGFMEAEPSMQIRNVLDMVVAMVFSRLPRDYGSQPTREAHFEMLLDHHIHIRRLWKKDFGRLPGRIGGRGPEDGDDEDEKENAEPVGLLIGETKLEDDFEQLGLGDEDDEEAEDWEAIAEEEQEEDDRPAGAYDEPEDDEPDESPRAHDTPAAKTSPSDGLGGYGADYDSEESGSDDDGEAPVQLPTVSAKRVVRRTRRKKMTREPAEAESPGRGLLPSPTSTRQSERDRELEAFMYGGGSGDSDDEAHGRGEGGRAFQSFARTGALQLLRAAKEKEGF